MNKVIVILITVLSCYGITVGTPTLAAKLQPVQNLEVKITPHDKIKVFWKNRPNAGTKQIRLHEGTRAIKNIRVRGKQQTFGSGLFESGSTYTVRVRNNATKQDTASRWLSKTITYFSHIDETPINVDVWLFAVRDNAGKIVLSGETENEVRLAEFSVNAPTSDLVWRTVFSSADTGDVDIVDHWHIYAHGYHWIVISTITNRTSYLLKLDNNFEVVASVQVTNEDEADDSPKVQTTPIYTNDMFLVAEDTGVAVGHFYPGVGHRVYRFSESLELSETVDIGGDEFIHANGASGYHINNTYIVFAPSTLDPTQESNLNKLVFDEDWQPISITQLTNVDNQNIAMPSAHFRNNGSYVIHARVIDNVDENSGDTDSGTIERFVFSKNDVLQSSSTVTTEPTMHRPHTLSLTNSGFLLTWDEPGEGGTIILDHVY